MRALSDAARYWPRAARGRKMPGVMTHAGRRTLLLGGLGVVACASFVAASPARTAPTFRAPRTGPVSPAPRPGLFLTGEAGRRALANVNRPATAAARFAALCPIDLLSSARARWPANVLERAGEGADTWPKLALACALSYVAAGKREALEAALFFWRTSLADDQRLGDARGCTADVDLEAWRAWEPRAAPPPAVIATIAHDDGYPYRWYGPYLALVHDWLHDAPGVDASLRAWSARCLTAWADFYTARGYHRDHPGSNYHAGFLLGKTLTAVALASDGPAGERLFGEVVDTEMGRQIVGVGLASETSEREPPPDGRARGNLRGGDWGEGWQYGPLSVLELATAARALEDRGVSWPALRAWTDDLALRSLHGQTPHPGFQYAGGDTERAEPWVPVTRNQLNAVLIGPSRPAAAALAARLLRDATGGAGAFIWDAFAEARAVNDELAPVPRAPWYFAPGTGTVYARSSFARDASWAVFASAPQVADDHHAHGASTFVFARGDDPLIVDAAPYARWSTDVTNALDLEGTARAPGGQTAESRAARPSVRATASGLVTAAADITEAFARGPRDNPAAFAARAWVYVPDGREAFIVLLDQARGRNDEQRLVVRLHTGARGSLRFEGGGAGAAASATIGHTRLVIHPVLPDEAPVGSVPARELRTLTTADEARFPHDLYTLTLPSGRTAVAHVLEALDLGGAPAKVSPFVSVAPTQSGRPPALPLPRPRFWGVTIARERETFHVLTRDQTHEEARAVAGKQGARTPWRFAIDATDGRAARVVLFAPPANGRGTSIVARRGAGAEGHGRCLVEVSGARPTPPAPGALLVRRAPAVFSLDEQCRPRDEGARAPDALP